MMEDYTFVVEDIISTRDINGMKVLAEHSNGDKGLLQMLLNASDDRWLAQKVAENCNADPEILSELALSKSHFVRGAVARSCNGDEYILNLLVEDEHPYVRAEVASQCYGNKEIIDKLIGDAEWTVRDRLAAGCRGDEQVLKILSADENKNVQVAARKEMRKYGIKAPKKEEERE